MNNKQAQQYQQQLNQIYGANQQATNLQNQLSQQSQATIGSIHPYQGAASYHASAITLSTHSSFAVMPSDALRPAI